MIHPKVIRKQRLTVLALLALILITSVIGMGMGHSSLSYNRLLPTFLGHVTFKEEFVLFSVRLPRIVITVLAGMALALSGAMIVLISSSERTKVEFIAKWLAGNIWGTDWPFILTILPWLLILIPFTLFKAHRLNLLTLSEPVAIGVGVSINRERFLMLLTAVALAAAAVSVTGGIAFVGLMAPHIAKALVGPKNQLFIPVAILIGGWLLLLADTIGRNLVDPEGIAAGIMTALIGAPYFIYLLLIRNE
jgi:iron complex transport system permease protein